jgi:tRNA(Ile)-lysidine synthase
VASAAASVFEALRAFRVRTPDLFEPATRLVVAFSGGQDSTCLLHALHMLQPDLNILAAHVDHALRPDSAEAGERACELAVSIGTRTVVRRVDVAGYRKQRSIQHAARAARYQVLSAIVKETGARGLLVAHTADDQAETVLLHLIRGSGLRGLSGMPADETIDPHRLGPPLQDVDVPEAVRVARPLLTLERATTSAYCAEIGLAVVEDASNQSRAYTRNRVRLDLLPLLEQFNPAIRSVLVRTAEMAADDVAALDEIVISVHRQVARSTSADAVVYDLRGFKAQPRALQRRLLRHALVYLVGTLEDVHAAPIEDALALVRSGQAGQAYHLPYGVELVIGDEDVKLRRFGAARRRVTTRNNWGKEASRV